MNKLSLKIVNKVEMKIKIYLFLILFFIIIWKKIYISSKFMIHWIIEIYLFAEMFAKRCV
jgi:hypothetical protein